MDPVYVVTLDSAVAPAVYRSLKAAQDMVGTADEWTESKPGRWTAAYLSPVTAEPGGSQWRITRCLVESS